jgi:tenascin
LGNRGRDEECVGGEGAFPLPQFSIEGGGEKSLSALWIGKLRLARAAKPRTREPPPHAHTRAHMRTLFTRSQTMLRGAQTLRVAVCVLLQLGAARALCPAPINGTECNGKGTCQLDAGVEACQCERGWGGKACSVTGCADPTCGGHGACEDPAVDPAVPGNMAACRCEGGWEGDNCETPAGACDPPCVAEQGTCDRGTCVCAQGFAGPTCGDLACGDGARCSGHGSCDAASSRCICVSGWTGLVCDTTQISCADPTCGGNGVCNEAIGECVCNQGFIGKSCDQLTCEDDCGSAQGRGACIADRCVCNDGFSGAGCKAKDCPNKCSGHGSCSPSTIDPTVAGMCACDPGFIGADCSQVPCANDCSGHGACNANKTACVCDPGYSGDVCTDCDGKHHCSNHGECVWSTETGAAPFTAMCECFAGFSTDNCAMAACPLGQSPVTTAVPTVCSGKGNCKRDAESGQYQCECDDGFGTVDCHAKCPRGKQGAGAICGGHGYCAESYAPTEAEYGTGICVCDAEWTGPTCEAAQCDMSVPATGGQARPCGGLSQGLCHKEKCYCRAGFSPPACASKECPSQCSGHGVCDDETDPNVPKCACDAGFGGEDCSEAACCDPTCSGHGTCKTGRCHCDKGFFGPGCAEKPDDAKAALAAEKSVCETTLRQCSGRGDCDEVNATCTCDEGFRGRFCEKKSCKKGCSERGTCQDDGTCKCDEGFAGKFCQRKACPNNCNGRGYCIAGTCFCRAGWEGIGCAARSCPNDCSSMGVCKSGVCACLNGYSGADCATAPCPGWIGGQQCSGHGICKDTVCSCTGRHEDPFDEVSLAMKDLR